jgi:EAL domain-containing protein (putative c-di-GMP-specific phosphodiesterase class I)
VLKDPYELCGHQLHITASIGISVYPGDGDNPEKLLMNADIAMYHAKEQMRNNCQFFNTTMNNSSLERMKLGNDLRQSLKKEELVVHYQPLMDSSTGKMVCAEALVRWKHPELGLLDAMQFIPLAEGIGVIMSIDRWVMTTVCAQNKEWQKAGYPHFCVTVNLSSHWFHQGNLVEVVSHVLRETGLSPEFLGLEITESTAMQDVEQTILTLTQLTDMGVKVLMDDFGTGYSSLNWLKKFPIQKLKIDKSFINELQKDSDDKAIVNAIVTMAHTLNLTVVAEGVETENQLSFLRSSGCDEIQGFLLGMPLPPDDFKKILADPE